MPVRPVVRAYDAVCKWFNHLKEQGHFIISYAIIPNHLNVIIAFDNTGKRSMALLQMANALSRMI